MITRSFRFRLRGAEEQNFVFSQNIMSSSQKEEEKESKQEIRVASIDVMKPIPSLMMSCSDSKCDFHVTPFQRRPLSEEDVLIKMKYCGVCHSDLHHAANHNHKFNETKYPCVPGHELAGIVIAVGKKVSKVKIGDAVGVGCMVDACLECDNCKKGEEQWCSKKNVGTYGASDRHGRAATSPVGGHTLGGYSQYHVCHERFVIVVPKGFPLQYVGPIMCAGITMYVGEGSKFRYRLLLSFSYTLPLSLSIPRQVRSFNPPFKCEQR